MVFAEFAHRPFSGTLVRSNLCAFVAGRQDDLGHLEVTVRSIVQFVPGMRVVVAAADDCLDVYERCVLSVLYLSLIRRDSNACLGLKSYQYALKYYSTTIPPIRSI